MNGIKYKKIYYVPGIISLILVPILFIYYTEKNITANRQNVIQLFWFSPEWIKKHPDFYPQEYPLKRNYIDINLIGDNQKDKIKLDFAQVRIKEIISQNDSLNGVHFIFSDNSMYWTFIKSIDILNIEKAKTYLITENNIWFYHIPQDTTLESLEFDCLLCDDVITIEPKISQWTKVMQWVNSICKSSWEIILSFITFLLAVLIIKWKYRS